MVGIISSFNIVDIHLLCITLLLIMFFNVRKNADMDKTTLRLFAFLVFSTIFAGLSDSCAWMCDGRNGILNFVFNTFYYFFVPMPCIAAYFLSTYLAIPEKAFSKPRLILGSSIYAILFFLTVSNIFTPTVFYIGTDLLYHRSPFVYLFNGLTYLFLFLSMIAVYKNKSEYLLKILASQLFWLPPIVTGIMQSLFFGVNLYVAGMTLSIFIFFISLQSKTLRLDYLTGVFNRRYFDAVVQEKIRDGKFSMILGDVDGFKNINDQYGHVVGDEVLISVASLLKVSVHKNDTVARYGGDEFVILIDTAEPEVLMLVIDRIRLIMEKFNTSHSYPFPVSISMGYDIYTPGNYKNYSDFIKHVDALMYYNKHMPDDQLSLPNAESK